ncbi:MAG: CZB domain-containing protein [Desulfobacterales bacterium]|nr:CZB domain-containing protein [Desulfobacterales bacterium]
MMKRMKLSTKLWGLTVLLLGAVAIVAASSIFSIGGILSASGKYAEAAGTATFMVEKEVDHLKWVNKVKDLFINKTAKLDVQLDYTKCGLGKFLYGEKGKALAASDTEIQRILESLKASHIRLHESGHGINKTVATQGHEAAHRVFTSKTLPALADTQAKMKALADRLNVEKAGAEASMKTTGTRAEWSAGTVTVLAIVIGGLLSFLAIRSTTGPLNRIIAGLNEGADQVSSAAGLVSTSSQSLAEGSAEQAASIEETSSSLEEMSSMTSQNADHARQADTLMQKTNAVVQEADTAMSELTVSMKEITSASEETSKIIKTIDEIAFQTNLLALNAAVEAARAGEAGAGFAVVADEVRNLAMRAADAAKNTAVLIEGTVKKINGGSELVASANEAFQQVAESSAKVGGLVGEIAAASNEQSQGIGQINTAVNEMDKVVQNNAACAEESASASEEMSAQAEQMKSMVGELVVLVDGSTPSERSIAPRTISAARRRTVANPYGKSTLGASRLKTVKKVGPKDLIPLDDDDFKDF